MAYNSNVKRFLSQLRTTNEKKSALVKGAQEKIAFKLPPGIEAPITPQYALVLWSVLLLGLLLYLAWSRSMIWNLCSKAIRIYRADSNVTDNDCIDLAYNMPIWLAPLPRKVNHISPEQLRDCLGWTFSHRNVLLAVSAMFTILTLVQLRIVYLSSTAANFLPSHLQSDFLQVVSLLLLSLLAIYFVLSFQLQQVPDYYANEKNHRLLEQTRYLETFFDVSCLWLIPPYLQIFPSGFAQK